MTTLERLERTVTGADVISAAASGSTTTAPPGESRPPGNSPWVLDVFPGPQGVGVVVAQDAASALEILRGTVLRGLTGRPPPTPIAGSPPTPATTPSSTPAHSSTPPGLPSPSVRTPRLVALVEPAVADGTEHDPYAELSIGHTLAGEPRDLSTRHRYRAPAARVLRAVVDTVRRCSPASGLGCSGFLRTLDVLLWMSDSDRRFRPPD